MRAFNPDWASPPGETIIDLLNERHESLNDLSRYLSRSIVDVRKLVSGELRIDSGLAEDLFSIFGGSSQFWVNRDSFYLKCLDREPGEIEKHWAHKIPLAQLEKLGWVTHDDTSGRLEKCLSFFGVKNFEGWLQIHKQQLENFAFRTSQTFEADELATSCWLRRGEYLAENAWADTWNVKRFKKNLLEIRKLTRYKPEFFIPKLRMLCAESGVAVVFAQNPKGCRASGASKMISAKKGMILLSFRHLRDDHFWFTFFHEAAHLILHGDLGLFVDQDDDAASRTEEEANEFAAEFLVPSETLERVPLRSRELIKFAMSIGVSAGVVVGQLQKSGRIDYSRLNSLKRKYDWENLNRII